MCAAMLCCRDNLHNAQPLSHVSNTISIWEMLSVLTACPGQLPDRETRQGMELSPCSAAPGLTALPADQGWLSHLGLNFRQH